MVAVPQVAVQQRGLGVVAIEERGQHVEQFFTQRLQLADVAVLCREAQLESEAVFAPEICPAICPCIRLRRRADEVVMCEAEAG